VFEPKKVDGDWKKYESFDDAIIDTSSNVALLEDGKVLTKTALLDIKIDESQRLISKSDGWIISSSIDGNLTLTSIKDKTLKKSFELKKTIASASVEGDTLAVLFANNEMALYDIPSKSIIFKEQGSKVLALDARIVNPYFMNDLVLFSTLDGKVVIVNSKLKKRLRTIIVSSEDEFNNIIYFNIVDNKIIAVTAYNILSMSQKEIRAKYEIRNVVYDDKNIYITTKQGEVISLTSSLEVNAKVKFPFAHFLGMISSDDKLYVLEKEGYLIVFDKKSFDYTIHEVALDNGFVFVADKMFYVANEKILVK
jgi:outer membrane protein assembly factor BamB